MLGFSHSSKILARVSLRHASSEATESASHQTLQHLEKDIFYLKWVLGGIFTGTLASAGWLHSSNLQLRTEISNKLDKLDNKVDKNRDETNAKVEHKFDRLDIKLDKLEDIIKNQNQQPRPSSPSPRPS